ncbi:MAG: 16S rRNA (adenine(1518)-N(6)/adenine(1519)-N(6))-dimethyltransferase RsmA, partial [Thermostichales cyanobacterium BF3_bins_165]
MPHPRKRFGQHWLKDAAIHQAIVQAAQLSPTTTVLEIGPGTGQLTRRLLAQGSRVIGVEIDRDLCQGLRRQFAAEPRFELIEGDFLHLPLPPTPTHVVANIPYNITGPILAKLLGSLSQPVGQFQRLVLLLQKEVAERLTASPGQKSYGALSVRIQYLAACQWICLVGGRGGVGAPRGGGGGRAGPGRPG